jgi:hypothetical protein
VLHLLVQLGANAGVGNEKAVIIIRSYRVLQSQVRHPLRVISTLLRRCAPWDRIWQWIHNLWGFEAIHDQLTPLVSDRHPQYEQRRLKRAASRRLTV